MLLDNILKENLLVKKVLSNDFNQLEDVNAFTNLLDSAIQSIELAKNPMAKELYFIYALDGMHADMKLTHYARNY